MLYGLGSDGQVGDCEWVGFRDLEKGFSPDSQPIGGYLKHAQGKARELAKNGLLKVKACQDKVSPRFCIESQKYLSYEEAKRVLRVSFHDLQE